MGNAICLRSFRGFAVLPRKRNVSRLCADWRYGFGGLMPISADYNPERAAMSPPLLSGSDRRTYDALFHHPSSHNLKWHDVVHLFERLGSVSEKPNHEYVIVIGDAQHVLHRPHSKDLTPEEIRNLRHFLVATAGPAGLATAGPPSLPIPAPDLLVVIDHHEARIFSADLPAQGTTQQDIRPYDPHHFLHHLTHKGQPRERGQRAHEDATYYDRIAQAVATARRIVIVGHGTGKSDAAHHLVEYLAKHHSETSQKLLCALTVDLSHITEPELFALAREAFDRFSQAAANV
jgi:hypothetical protein